MAAASPDAHDPQAGSPAPARDPELPTVSETTLGFFAAGALVVTAVALLVLL